MNEELKLMVVRLNEARRIAEQFKAELAASHNDLEIAWKQNEGNKLEALGRATIEVADLEADIRALAVAAYQNDPQKQKDLGYGVGIRIMTRLDYDAKTALGWAQKTGLALRLDTPAFEKVAKASNLPFVQSHEEPQATIASDLAKALKEKP